MQYYSDLTKKLYPTEEKLEAAEKEYKAEEEKKAKISEGRKARAKEVEEAWTNYRKLLDDFVKDYGSFHMTISDSSTSPIIKAFDTFFNF